jgi:HD-GYP domain-containing protein (c-di-GMP phosphodiesterase class II)
MANKYNLGKGDFCRLENTRIGRQGALDASVQLDAILRVSPDLLLTIDRDGLILDYRAGKTFFLNFPPEQSLGHPIQDFLPTEVVVRFNQALQEAIRTDKVVSIQFRLEDPAGTGWFEAHLVPLKNESRLIVIMRNVSERVRSAEQIQRQVKRLAVLQAIDTAITASFDLKVTLAVILRQLINQLGADAADILVLNPTTHMLEYAAGQGFQTRKLQKVPLMIGQGCAGRAALERRTISIPDLGKQPVESSFTVELLQENFANYFAVPLIAKGQVKGVLETYHHAVLQPDDDWLDFLANIAGQTAMAIDSASLFQDLQRTNAELNLAYDATIESWAQILEISNRERGEQSTQVAELTIKLARSMGIAEKELIHFRRGALLHDIGNLGISEAILNKPDSLDEAELKTMQSHPRLAYQLLSHVNYLTPILDILLYHHERWDGSGYPDGLCGDQIPFPARLFAVVDVYDALTSPRPHRPAKSHQAAMNHLQQQSGKLFDPAVVSSFTQIARGKSVNN